MHDAKWKTSLRRRLLGWFDKHQRDLPWRHNKTPYRIWISEIMLQQTQVATVIDYYNRFIKTFPNVQKLAAADEADVLKLWEGLGYYRRARQMHAAAIQIVNEHGGKFPTQFDDVLALPGIGRYTAGAILSISQDQPHPILEGNTIRLFSRLMLLKSDPRSTQNQKQLWAFSQSLLPKKRIGDFNQALMELGSEICTPRNPECPNCPLMSLCPTFARSLQSEIPLAKKKVQYEDLHEAIIVVQRNGKFLMRECQPGERWAGLWDFPRFQLDCVLKSNSKGKDRSHGMVENGVSRSVDDIARSLETQLKENYGLTTSLEPTGNRIKHAVTRYRITLDCFLASDVSGRVKNSGLWKSPAEISRLAMSVTGRKIAKKLVIEKA